MKIIDELSVDENFIAFYPMLGNSYQLNEIGANIIALLKEEKNREEILEELSNNYDIDKNTLYIDINDFLSKLKIYGLLV